MRGRIAKVVACGNGGKDDDGYDWSQCGDVHLWGRGTLRGMRREAVRRIKAETSLPRPSLFHIKCAESVRTYCE